MNARSKIEAAIRAAFQRDEIRLFWPQQFESFASEDDAIETFHELERDHKVRIFAAVYCSNGHEAWLGEASRLGTNRPTSCEQCAISEPYEESAIVVHAEVTSDWATELAQAKKKDLQTLPS